MCEYNVIVCSKKRKIVSKLIAVVENGAYPGWNCLNFLHVFVGYQANFPWFYKNLKEMSLQ